MTRPEPIIIYGLHVFAAMNVDATINAQIKREINCGDVILANVIIFAKDLDIADFMLNLMGYWPECEVIFYLHLPDARTYRPLIRAVTPNKESFPYFYQN